MARPGKNNPTGEQTRYKKTKETVAKLEQAAALDATIEEMCFYAGIDHATFHRWMKADPKLCDRITALRNSPVLLARQTVMRDMQTNSDLAMKYLERKRKKEFSPRIDLGVDGTVNHTIEVDEETNRKLNQVFSLFERQARESLKELEAEAAHDEAMDSR